MSAPGANDEGNEAGPELDSVGGGIAEAPPFKRQDYSDDS
jgi:hypothetical protein